MARRVRSVIAFHARDRGWRRNIAKGTHLDLRRLECGKGVGCVCWGVGGMVLLKLLGSLLSSYEASTLSWWHTCTCVQGIRAQWSSVAQRVHAAGLCGRGIPDESGR